MSNSEECKSSSAQLELVSRRTVAAMLGVCTETIKRMQRTGKLPAVVFNSRLVRYNKSDVDRIIQDATA